MVVQGVVAFTLKCINSSSKRLDFVVPGAFPPRVIHSVCKLLVIPGFPSQRGEVLSGTFVVVGQVPSGISPTQSYFLMKRLVIVVGSRASTSRVVVAALNYLYHSALSLIISRVGGRVVIVT